MSTRWLGYVAALVSAAYLPAVPCAQGLFDQINRLLAAKQYEETSRLLDQMQKCPGLSTMEMFQLGWLYGRARHFDKALNAFSRVPPDVPDRATHDYAVALSKFELADYHGAIQVLEASRSDGDLGVNASNLLAVAYSKLTLFKEAYQILTDQLAKTPADLTTYLNLVSVCAEGGDYQKAAQVASHATARFPDSAEVFVARGAADSLLGNPTQAAQDFSTAARLAPDQAGTRFLLALTQYNQGQYTQAISVIKQAEKDGLRDSDLHYLMAECLLKAGSDNRQLALSQLNRALELNPHSISAETLRGKLLLENGQAQAALADLESAHLQDPSSRSVVYNLARAYQAVGQRSRASTLFQELRSAQPEILKETGDKRLGETFSLDGPRQ